MGYLLSFARSMQITSKKNRLTLEQMTIQNQQNSITNSLTMLNQMAAALKDDEGSLAVLNMEKEMLTMMSNSLDMRLKGIQTQIMALSKEEQNLETALNEQIERSTPKYVG